MTCPDTRALLFDNLPEAEKERLRAHLAGCEACRLETERLKATTLALRSVPDEEPPVRIRFVSDRVFEPSWWQRLNPFGSPGLLAHAAMALSTVAAAAILITIEWGGYGARSSAQAQHASVDQAGFEQKVQQAVEARLNGAVAQAVREVEARQDVKFRGMLAEYHKQQQQDEEKLLHQVEAAWRYQDQLKTRALYAALEKPDSGSGQ
jgi:anti-sigma factor RsiW